MDGSLASLELGAGIAVRPDLVADSHRPVQGRGAPLALPARLKRDAAFDIAQARDARRGILIRAADLLAIVGVGGLSGILSSEPGRREGNDACQNEDE